ncbi:MAG: oligosaccharide flippase family protein [Fibrobacter sp.]|jgi:Na+-driven multidrug efflux pump|nr:oligosaccharide flippase family protein [Fibrobacter sp.]
MTANSENNKRIAKNTLFLYFRMLLTMGISLYTSRVVLSTLGVEDFGIYGVVGGVVAMFSFINSSLSSATSRFLTFSLSKGDTEDLKKTFSSALTIHILIAFVILILAETIGLWFLENKLVIPEYRMSAARWVYQFSVLSTLIAITQVPYNAVIISHERMHIYAYVEILNVSLKLGVVYLLVIGNFDKLILYAALIFVVSVLIAMIYRIYCLKKFTVCKYKFEWNKKYIYPMLSFSGWDLYGNMSVVARTQGVNVLLNLFFGAVLNAANGIAVQVQGAVMAFANNIITAVRPQIVKSYAARNYSYTIKLVLNAAKYIYLLLLVLSLPLILEMNFILNLWLKNVPPHAVSFCRLTLLFNFFATMSFVVVSAIHATGNIKRPSLINGSLYLAVIPVSYAAFKFNGIPEFPYLCNVLFIFIGMLSNVYTLKLYLPEFSIRKFILNVLSVCLLISFVSFLASYGIREKLPEGFLRFFTVSAVSTIIIAGMTYFIAIDKQTKQLVKEKIARKWKN